MIFAGLPDAYESEAMDREHLRMPQSHNGLIKRVCEVNPNTIVVLSNGAMGFSSVSVLLNALRIKLLSL